MTAKDLPGTVPVAGVWEVPGVLSGGGGSVTTSVVPTDGVGDVATVGLGVSSLVVGASVVPVTTIVTTIISQTVKCIRVLTLFQILILRTF